MESNSTQAVETTNYRTQSYYHKLISVCVYCNAIVFAGLAIYFFIIPLGIMIYSLTDPGLRGDGVPRIAFDLHRSLSPRYERWASGRIASSKAANLSIENISGTEWPMFGSVFYMWATENLQNAWEKDHTCSSVAPNVYAKGAIEQAATLIADKNNAAWVQKHWGSDYLHNQNTFYRMLLISGLTSHYKLLHDEKYLPIIRDQVNTLAKEIDESPYGWLDDYPNQCYPTDVLVAIAAIKRADAILGTDHSEFVKRAYRGFDDKLVDKETGLPTYEGDSQYGIPGVAHGCSNAWALMWSPCLWPEAANKWYASAQNHFWQNNWFACGFREFPKNNEEGEWYFDVDSGPVISGLGAAASAFGIAASRVNGRFDHAFPICAELVTLSCPLPNGTLLLPRLLSNNSDAPHLGEASILFILTRSPANGMVLVKGSRIPGIVYLALTGYALIALTMILATRSMIRRWCKNDQTQIILPKFQFSFWLLCLFIALVFWVLGNGYLAILALLIAQFVPKTKKLIHQSTDK